MAIGDVWITIKSNRQNNDFKIGSNPDWTSGSGYWRIPSDGLIGFDSPEFTVYSEISALREGSVNTGTSVSGRNLTIKIESTSMLNSFTDRSSLEHYFMLNDLYDMTIKYKDSLRVIKNIKLQKREISLNNVYQNIKATLSFFSEDPYFTSAEKQTISFGSSGGSFPYYLFGDVPVFFSLSFYTYSSASASSIVIRSYHYDLEEKETPLIYESIRSETMAWSAGDKITIPDSSKLQIYKNDVIVPLDLYHSSQLMIYPPVKYGELSNQYLSTTPAKSAAQSKIEYWPKYLGI